MKIEMDMPEPGEGQEYTGSVSRLDADQLDALSEIMPVIVGAEIFAVHTRDKPWRAERDHHYYCIDDSGARQRCREISHPRDTYRFRAGNYYQTKEEAELAAERVLKAYKE